MAKTDCEELVGAWFGKKCEHRLDWFHVARRIARIEKKYRYLPYGDDFQNASRLTGQT
jgi:hypothetical protein